MTTSILVEGLTRIFPAKRKGQPPLIANHQLSFEVKRGELFGLLGPNGAGKTTLINQLLGLLKPTSGSIQIEGIDVVQMPDLVKPFCGFLPQSGLPMRYIEVQRALYYTGRLRGLNHSAAQKQASQLIEQLGLGAYADRYVNKLSGGELRLTNFAMALMGRLRLLILDEPTNELDPQKRRLVWDIIATLNREQGVTTILVTHNVLEAERVIQRVAVMQQGKFIALGTPSELKTQNGGKLRMEFRLNEGEKLNLNHLTQLEQLGKVEEALPGLYRLHLSPPQIGSATDLVLNQWGLVQMEDFRVVPPSLEDVYLDLNKTEVA